MFSFDRLLVVASDTYYVFVGVAFDVATRKQFLFHHHTRVNHKDMDRDNG
jgi:hypothetical protein